MDGSNTTDNDFDNEILLIRKDENLSVFGERDELSVFMFCMGNVSRAAGSLWMERYHETTSSSSHTERESESGHITQS